LVNVRVPRKPPLDQFPPIQGEIARANAALGNDARILVRYSGTENLARVMIEGQDAAAIAREANAIATVIQETIT
jgi:phosphoglucosamine mutase